MFKEMIDTGTALKDANQVSNINERAKYTANTGTVQIATANANLSGAGATVIFITGSDNGTLVKNITVQALVNTTKGVVRLFVSTSSSTFFLLDEIEIPAVVRSATGQAFSVTYDLDYELQAGISLAASTQNGERFAVTGQGLDYKY